MVEGEVEIGRRYTEAEFNRIIEIERRERQRVEILLSQINPREKTLVFCATQEHALAIRDLINQLKSSTDPNYCQRVTADDGELGTPGCGPSRTTRRRSPPSSPPRRSSPLAWMPATCATLRCCGRSTR